MTTTNCDCGVCNDSGFPCGRCGLPKGRHVVGSATGSPGPDCHSHGHGPCKYEISKDRLNSLLKYAYVTLEKLKVYSRGLYCKDTSIPVWDSDDEIALNDIKEALTP